MKNDPEYNRLIAEANEVKDRLYQISMKLEEKGYTRKAKSCMTIIHRIEWWQHSKP